MASDGILRYRQAAREVVTEARAALARDCDDDDGGRRWVYLALLELVGVEAIEAAGWDAHLTFLWHERDVTYTRTILVHASDASGAVRTGHILEARPGRGMTRVWLGAAAPTDHPSRMLDAEVPSWTNANAAACSAC